MPWVVEVWGGHRWPPLAWLEVECRRRWLGVESRPAVPNAVCDHRAVIWCISLIVRTEQDALWLGC
jgi:hypothetical protein